MDKFLGAVPTDPTPEEAQPMTIRLSAVDEKATLEDISPQPALSTFGQNWRMPAKKDNSSNVGTGQTLLFWREGKDGAIHATVKGKESLQVLKVPHDALRPGAQDEVFVVENDALVSRHLAFSIAPDGTLLVRRGLSASDRVVLAPRSDAEAGDRVTLRSQP